MSCCRRALPRRRDRALICANCRASLRDAVKAVVDREAAARPTGRYRVVAEVTCGACRYTNKMPVVFDKQ
jgi:hypothetical protein